MHRRNTVPSIATLENICDAFGITLSQFFNEDSEYVHLNTEQSEMFHQWVSLTATQKDLICRLIQEMK
jgi:transcriptional regulator with XRE-family HTH domain